MVAPDFMVHDVWASNFDTEFANLRKAAQKATHVIPFIEFPGLCMTPLGTFFSKEQYTYQQLLVNVNALKPIQFGFTFVYESSNTAESNQLAVYQFNLHFDLNEDMFTNDAIQAYEEAGLNFQRHSTEGIKLLDFGELLTTSGLIASKITWASFHSAFDFGFLTRSLYGGVLPSDVRLFCNIFNKYFSKVYDIKHMMNHPNLAHRGLKPEMSLQEVADVLKIQRSGPRHVASWDSLLAAHVFLQLKSELNLSPDDEISKQLVGIIYGIGKNPILPQGAVIQSIFTAKTSQSINNSFDDRRRPFSIPKA
ncbi:Poly(A)-specific ribonuclease [Aphelenchoides bicaudatus]|nr:Poly(A)-specific ribonuclease [Aphelenchoides bicaudatus]